ncbi:MAG: hypothetical protein KAX49_16540 [Halanaerobiales bacterium]|nr:hypothetical protein [Halanaerobiales bacterium]
MKHKAHIISHTHWDREWYLNSKYTNEWLVPFFDHLFLMLEKEDNYQFVLDGQMAMIDDYYDELKKQGKGVYPYREKIKKYVQERRLFVGPYYLQPDWQLLSEEALVRNLLVGHKKAFEYGDVMRVGWLLDNFGQISQTAQIHKECNIKGLYAWRGVEMDPFDVQSEFNWESPDGSVLPSIYLLNSYRNVMRLAEYEDIIKERINDEVEKLIDFATTDNILLMNGYDQEMVPDDIQPFIKRKSLDTEKYEVIQSNPENYLGHVMRQNPKLKTLKGALYSGRFIAVFPGVMSSRMYLKLQNDASQKAIEKLAEPLSTLSWLQGGDYDQVSLDKAWELLLKNHPHDSICGVSIDDVHIDMEERTQDFQFIIDHLIRVKLQEMVRRINTSGCTDNALVVFNPSFYSRTEVLSLGGESILVKDIPAMGYKVVREHMDVENLQYNGNKISNGKIDVLINRDGSIDIYHKATTSWYRNLGVIEDAGDAGDEYNYSYPDMDQIISTKNMDAQIEFVEKSDVRTRIKVTHILNIPEELMANRKARSEVQRILPVQTLITVEAESDVVKFRTEIKNTVKDHIVRVLFPTGIETDHSLGGSPFDIVKRPIHIEDYDESMIPHKVKKVIIGAREAKPNTIFLGRELVDVNDSVRGFAVLSKGLPEYVIRKEDNTIALTLFRSVGWVAKEINTRIGDAGPEIFTPHAQCLRQMVFEYAVYPHAGDFREGGVLRKADQFNTDLQVVATEPHPGELPEEQSYFQMEGSCEDIKITCFKRSENGEGIIIRFFNGSDQKVPIKIGSSFEIRQVQRVNLLEEKQEELTHVNGQVMLDVEGKKIVTLYLELEKSCLKRPEMYFAELVKDKRPADFSDYEAVEIVTLEEIAAEAERAEKLKTGLNDPMVRRTALEAQLSTILARHRRDEQTIREMGYQLNEARVNRRVYDYIKQYTK